MKKSNEGATRKKRCKEGYEKSILSDGVCTRSQIAVDGCSPVNQANRTRLHPWIQQKRSFLPLPLRHREIPRKHPLLPRINLINHILRRIRIPRTTRILHHRRQHLLLNQRVLLNRIDIQPPTNMPRNMAMKRPRARIVRVVL